MKQMRTWFVIAVLLGGCSTGVADTAERAGTASPRAESETTERAVDATGSGAPVPLESIGADAREDDGFLTQPTPLPPGTYRSSTYDVPVTFTTTDRLTLFAVGVSLIADPEFSRALDVSQPAQVADLTRTVSREDLEDAGQVNIPEDHLIGVPDDIGAWLAGAEAIDIVDEGATNVGDQQAPWWDLELRDRGEGELACEARPGPPPCQALWPSGPQTGLGAIVAVDTVTRIWAVPAPAGDLLVVAQTQAPADDAATSAWFETAEEIVASLEFD